MQIYCCHCFIIKKCFGKSILLNQDWLQQKVNPRKKSKKMSNTFTEELQYREYFMKHADSLFILDG